MSTKNQKGDVLLFQINDGGEIDIESGIVKMSSGLETSVYLSLFGGNEDDTGKNESEFTWWANLDEIDPVNQYRSETQNLLSSIPANSSNLLRIEEAAKRDLKWLIEKKIASEIKITASITAVNRVNLNIEIVAIGRESTFDFVANWRASV